MTDEKDQVPRIISPFLFNALVIGAGPTGLAVSIALQQQKKDVILIEKGCICNSIYHYPSTMIFNTPVDRMQIGQIPFTTTNDRPTRQEALHYYRNVASYFKIDVRQYHRVTGIQGKKGNFTVLAYDRFQRANLLRTENLIIATGYYDQPNLLNIPGEDLSKVYHYYFDAHPFYGTDVVVIGGRNSATMAALDLWRHGARVTLVVRESELHESVKYWLKPEIEEQIRLGNIQACFNSHVTEIDTESVTINTPNGEIKIWNDFVFAMTGYKPDFALLEKLGVEFEGQQHRPIFDPQTMESNVKGIYLAGVVTAGNSGEETFIEQGRIHAELIANSLTQTSDPDIFSRLRTNETQGIEIP